MQFRRFVTILFADVVESMALAEALDPEVVAEIMRRYFDTVCAQAFRELDELLFASLFRRCRRTGGCGSGSAARGE